ncbi:MAG TPA: glycosyltransferase, partial [Humisphaera sp.]
AVEPATPAAASSVQAPAVPPAAASTPYPAVPPTVMNAPAAPIQAAPSPAPSAEYRPAAQPAPQPPAPPTAAPAAPAVPTAKADVKEPALLFEVAWEVCWQLGGIYTVLRSKAVSMIDRWGDRYCLIGPYNPSTAAVEFEEQPTFGPIREAMNRLRDMGIPSHFGRWLIAGRPRVLLIDYRARFGQLGVDKHLMWEDHRIELPAHDGEVNEVVAFGFAVTEFFRLLTEVVQDRQILAHFHEWMGGVAVPRIAHLRLPVATVFTTHATLLGRYLAGDNPYFYDHLPFLDPDKEAGKYQIYPRFAIERAAAHASTVFTTVSDVTGVEAAKLLGRTPELIVPNGINLHRFAAPHEFQHLHAKSKERIHEFVMGHFFPSYSFDLDRTLYVFTSGRYEYRNKGMDMFVEAMHRLNWRLKGMTNPPTVVGFVITRAPTRHINVQVLQNQSMYEDLRNTCKDIQDHMGSRLLNCTVRGQVPGFNDLLKEDDQVRLKRAMHAWKSHRQPLIVTHDLADDANDPVLNHLRHRHMFNAADDPVKMVFHPEFLTATNPVMSMDYEQFVRGCHMGIFPSYYEPWGYTPLECLALGVPTVTSDLAGFGSYLAKHVYPKERREADRQGAYIVQRRGKGFDEACDALVNHLFNFCQLTRRQRIEMRNRTERLAEQFDWGQLARHYDEAHNLALERVGSGMRVGHVEVRVV